LAILNEEGKGKPAPYTIDMEAYAWFEISPNFPTTDRESLVRINGASLIIGSIARHDSANYCTLSVRPYVTTHAQNFA